MIRLAVRVRREDAELVLAELLELAPGGVEERDLGDGVVEYAIYGAPGELPELPDLRAAAGGALVEVVTSEVADDWDERWRRVPPPGRDRPSGCGVRPPWDAGRAAGCSTLVIDPGQAFGTGAHAHDAAVPRAAARARAGAARRSSISAAAPACWRSRPPSSAGRRCSRVDHEPETRRARRRRTRAPTASRSTFERASTCVRGGPAPTAPPVLANLLRPLLLSSRAPASTARRAR